MKVVSARRKIRAPLLLSSILFCDAVRLTRSEGFANVKAGHEGMNHEGYGAFVVFYL